MSLHMIFTIIQLLPLRSPNHENPAEGVTNEGWTYWLYLLPSRGMYSLLVSLILCCCIINAIQNKFKIKQENFKYFAYNRTDVTNWVEKLWKNVCTTKLIPCSPLRVQRFPGFGFNAFDFEADLTGGENLFDKVALAEGEVEALRNAVGLAQRVGSDLEENVEEAEKDKDEIEGRSIIEKQWRLMEIETAKNDMQSLQEQLQLLKMEKEEVVIKCQQLQEEAQNAGVVLQKRQQIQERLDEALTVVSVLKKAVADLEADRDEALESLEGVLSDLQVTEESREKLANLVYRNMRNKMEGTLNGSNCVEDIHMLGHGDDLLTSNHVEDAQQWVNYGELGYGEMIVSAWNADEYNSVNESHIEGTPSDRSLLENDEHNDYENETFGSLEEELDEEQIEMSRNVHLTSSVAFRQFYQSTFGET